MHRLVLAATLAAFAAPVSAATYVLDFTGLGVVPDTYGDSSEADLSYRAIDATQFGNVATTNTLQYWTTGYGDLPGALWGTPNPSHGEIRIEATNASDTVTIASFLAGGWVADEALEWYVYDLSFNQLSSGTGTAPDLTSVLVSPNTSATGGLIFQWGGDAWDVGINEFTFSVGDPNPTIRVTVDAPAVPLPAAGWALLTGLGGFAAMRRQARRATQG